VIQHPTETGSLTLKKEADRSSKPWDKLLLDVLLVKPPQQISLQETHFILITKTQGK
jgi:hypothetical protein